MNIVFFPSTLLLLSHTALISSLAAAEARCMKLEQQLQHMKKMLLSVKADRHSMLKEQVRRLAPFWHAITIRYFGIVPQKTGLDTIMLIPLVPCP